MPFLELNYFGLIALQSHECPLTQYLFFSPCSILAEDEEDTIAAQEKVEGNVDHTVELDDLAKEGR